MEHRPTLTVWEALPGRRWLGPGPGARTEARAPSAPLWSSLALGSCERDSGCLSGLVRLPTAPYVGGGEGVTEIPEVAFCANPNARARA